MDKRAGLALLIALLMSVSTVGCDDGGGGGDNNGDEDAATMDTSEDTGSADAAEDTAEEDTSEDTSEDVSQDTATDTGSDAGTEDPLACPPLPDATGTTVTVTPSEAGQLPEMVRTAEAGTTFLLEDGTYELSSGQALQFRAEGVTLRSASNDASKVIIDGQYELNEIAFVVASDVTIAHVTLTRAVDHAVHVTATGDAAENTTGALLYGLRIIDCGEQFVKGNPNGSDTAFPDEGRVECSYFEMTDAGRPNVERNPGGCYTGGIDVHSGRDWVVRNNEFRGIYCAGEGLAEHAVHFWSDSRGTLTENNLIVNCARGIGYGLVENGNDRDYADDPYPNVDGHIGHVDGIIRNNVIFADIDYYDTGIELAQARGAKAFHNTIYTVDAANKYSSIDYRFPNTDATIQNNLVDRITVRNGASGTVDHNLEGIGAGLFVDAGALDFHLADDATDAIDQGVEVSESGVDIDGEPHSAGAGPDIGADEVLGE
ncbi:MAG: hypothetical protein ACQEVA_22780 [Myxococcota bacterium]